MNQGASNVWDRLSDDFSAHEKDEIDPYAADNIVIAWPVIQQFIQSRIEDSNSKKNVLDFGCGTGWFANELDSMGCNVTGIDSSKRMIDRAIASTADTIHFVTGDANMAFEISTQTGLYDMVLGMMVFQFIDDIQSSINALHSSMSKKASLVFAVFNPEWTKRCLAEGTRFGNFDNDIFIGKGVAYFQDGNEQCPVFIRTDEEYDKIIEPFGFKRKLTAFPEFTPSFIKKFGAPGPSDVSEYMILGYDRI